MHFPGKTKLISSLPGGCPSFALHTNSILPKTNPFLTKAKNKPSRANTILLISFHFFFAFFCSLLFES
jgi:hypothetical protein